MNDADVSPRTDQVAVLPASDKKAGLPHLNVVLQGVSAHGKLPVVLSHALGLNLHMWDDLAQKLVERGHEVMRYDHRGHGTSESPAGEYTMASLVSDAARLIREWNRGPVLWIGLSMGGMVGQGLAIEHPEMLAALVIANSTSSYPDAARTMWDTRVATVRAGGIESIADAVMERYFASRYRSAEPAAVQGFRRQLVATDPTGYIGCCRAVAGVDWTDRLHTIRCPTLVIAGAEDMGAPVTMSEAIVERVPGAELAVIERCSHLSVVEQPAQFLATLERFLETSSPI